MRTLMKFGLVVFMATQAEGHPGGLNAEGCHNNRKTGGYHCHRASAAPARAQTLLSADGGSRAFPHCRAAGAAGAAPVRAGDPGYGPHLDREDDGAGCEYNPDAGCLKGEGVKAANLLWL